MIFNTLLYAFVNKFDMLDETGHKKKTRKNKKNKKINYKKIRKKNERKKK